VGALIAVISVLIFQAGILSVGAQPQQSTNNILYYIIAFLVGYREETFRELIKRVTDIILTPAASPAAPSAQGIGPANGPVAGGTVVTITGIGFTGVTAVKFGTSDATYSVDSDGQLTVVSPSATAPGPVSIVVIGKGGSSKAGEFTYQ
jgi:hypothetical protein